MTSTDADRARWKAANRRNRERLLRERSSQLVPPPGWTAEETHDLALRLAGAVICMGGGKNELADLLRATGLLYDPEQISGMQLAHPQSHPFGERWASS